MKRARLFALKTHNARVLPQQRPHPLLDSVAPSRVVNRSS